MGLRRVPERRGSDGPIGRALGYLQPHRGGSSGGGGRLGEADLFLLDAQHRRYQWAEPAAATAAAAAVEEREADESAVYSSPEEDEAEAGAEAETEADEGVEVPKGRKRRERGQLLQQDKRQDYGDTDTNSVPISDLVIPSQRVMERLLSLFLVFLITVEFL